MDYKPYGVLARWSISQAVYQPGGVLARRSISQVEY